MGEETVNTEMMEAAENVPCRMCSYVPDLVYNFVSISKATESGKIVQFNSSGCRFINHREEMIAFAERCDNLFHLKANKSQMSANTMSKQNKLRLWHRCFGHLNTQSIYRMVKEELVNNLDCSTSCEVEFCEACIGGKQCKKSFEATKTSTTTPLELVHSDICGKMGMRYGGVAEYFLTLLDDKTRYIWIYPHTKDKVCQRFKEWQAEVENSKG